MARVNSTGKETSSNFSPANGTGLAVRTAIKDILTDATITFSENGMKIINFDKTHTILVNVILHAGQFECFKCEPNKIIVCANTIHLFKVISTMSNDDTLSMYIEKNDYHDGIVSHLGLVTFLI